MEVGLEGCLDMLMLCACCLFICTLNTHTHTQTHTHTHTHISTNISLYGLYDTFILVYSSYHNLVLQTLNITENTSILKNFFFGVKFL